MEEQQQAPISSSPYQSPMHNYGSSILYMTNPEQEVYKLELALRGKKLNHEGDIIEIGQPLLNDKGINAMLGIVSSIVNRDTIMSNVDDKEVRLLTMNCGEQIIKDLFMNSKDYGIIDDTTRSRIHNMILNIVYVTLKRGYKEGDKRFWKGSVQEIRSTVENSQKKSLWNKLNPLS